MKVSKTKLAEAIRAKMTATQAQYDAQMEEFMASFEIVQGQIILALQEAVKSAKSAKEFAHLRFLSKDRYDSKVSVPLPVVLPRKPEKPYELAHAERDLRMLELSAEDTVNIREGDRFAQYL